jgi:hypothetical protein
VRVTTRSGKRERECLLDDWTGGAHPHA